jgi:hypothetical protein
MSCKVALCRFPETHITTYHRCGNCKKYGHGRVECCKGPEPSTDPLDEFFSGIKPINTQTYCQNYDKINALYNLPIEPLPIERHCTINNCPIKHTHSSSAHHSDFDEYADESGPDSYGIRRMSDEGTKKVKLAVSKYPGTYAKIYWGMGNFIYARNNDNNIEVSISDRDNTHFTNGYKKISIPSNL